MTCSSRRWTLIQLPASQLPLRKSSISRSEHEFALRALFLHAEKPLMSWAMHQVAAIL